MGVASWREAPRSTMTSSPSPIRRSTTDPFRPFSQGEATMTAPPAQFIWYELITPDLDAALAFYRDVIGWSAHDSGLADRRYAILSAGERGVGGAMPLPPQAAEGGAR